MEIDILSDAQHGIGLGGFIVVTGIRWTTLSSMLDYRQSKDIDQNIVDS